MGLGQLMVESYNFKFINLKNTFIFLILMNYSENKRIYYVITLVAILALLYRCNSPQDSAIQNEIDIIAKRWGPDKREAICTITAESNRKNSIILHGETTVPEARNEIIKTLSKSGINLIDSIILLPDTVNNNEFHGLVALSVINLRKLPDHRSELVSQALMGTPVMILKRENSWLLIQTPDMYISWTEISSVKMMSTSEMAEWKQSEKLIYMKNSGWIFVSPSESGVVGDLVAGNIFRKLGEKGNYFKISLPDDREGFIRKKEVMDFNNWKNQNMGTEDNICRIALSFLGLPYLWGGSSSKGVDCSGFVQSVYFMNGIILSRDASLQALHGNDIQLTNGFNQLEKGDLLFFGSKNNSVSNVTHVAIYKGDSEYIHSSGRVMINSLDSNRINFNRYRKNSLLIARRILGVEDDMGIVPVYKHPWY
jgi:SH3-like domain-containing protein